MNGLPIIESLCLRRDFWDGHGANIATHCFISGQCLYEKKRKFLFKQPWNTPAMIQNEVKFGDPNSIYSAHIFTQSKVIMSLITSLKLSIPLLQKFSRKFFFKSRFWILLKIRSLLYCFYSYLRGTQFTYIDEKSKFQLPKCCWNL